jgi:hypothetical protein
MYIPFIPCNSDKYRSTGCYLIGRTVWGLSPFTIGAPACLRDSSGVANVVGGMPMGQQNSGIGSLVGQDSLQHCMGGKAYAQPYGRPLDWTSGAVNNHVAISDT